MLGVDDFVERGMGVGVSTSANVGLALQKSDARARGGERHGCGETSEARADDQDVVACGG